MEGNHNYDEENLQQLKRYEGAEDKHGKESTEYLYKKLYQLRVVTEKEEEEQLVSESEEIIQLAHKLNFHQQSVYGEMLWRLAMLSAKHNNECALLRVSEEILDIGPSNPLLISQYFDIISYLMDADEFVKVEKFLKLIEAWPEETFIKHNQRIHR